eukprot:748558-Hanusia_phi.AAC.2
MVLSNQNRLMNERRDYAVNSAIQEVLRPKPCVSDELLRKPQGIQGGIEYGTKMSACLLAVKGVSGFWSKGSAALIKNKYHPTSGDVDPCLHDIFLSTRGASTLVTAAKDGLGPVGFDVTPSLSLSSKTPLLAQRSHLSLACSGTCSEPHAQSRHDRTGPESSVGAEPEEAERLKSSGFASAT